MKREDRKALRESASRRAIFAGIYALRCLATGAVWAGLTRDLESQARSTGFMLKAGGFADPDLRALWKTHGAAGFAFEVLEQIEPGENPSLLGLTLKERAAHWRAALGAAQI